MAGLLFVTSRLKNRLQIFWSFYRFRKTITFAWYHEICRKWRFFAHRPLPSIKASLPLTLCDGNGGCYGPSSLPLSYLLSLISPSLPLTLVKVRKCYFRLLNDILNSYTLLTFLLTVILSCWIRSSISQKKEHPGLLLHYKTSFAATKLISPSHSTHNWG